MEIGRMHNKIIVRLNWNSFTPLFIMYYTVTIREKKINIHIFKYSFL